MISRSHTRISSAAISLLLVIPALFSACDGGSTNPSDPGENAGLMKISGNITTATTALAGVTVSLTREGMETLSSATDTTGNYIFDDLETGSYTIAPQMTGYTFSPASLDISLSRADSIENNFIAIPDGTSDDPGDNPGDNDDPGNPGEQIRLVFTGDINLSRGVAESVDANGNGDYNYIFRNVSSYLGSFDLTIGNLESIISDKGTDTKQTYGVSLRAVPAAVSGLAGAGFDIVSVTNNHSGDFGQEGMLDSFARIKAAGIDISGGGNNYNEAHTPVIRDVNGVKIACLSYGSVPMYIDVYLSQVSTNKWIATADKPGIAWAHNSKYDELGSLDDMADDIAAADALADVVVLMVHFGNEYDTEPNDFQKTLAHAAIDAGANIVIGHHPHVVQKTETYNGGYIAYSLGNFVFDQTETNGTTRDGLVVEATITGGAVTEVNTRKTKINDNCQVSLVE